MSQYLRRAQRPGSDRSATRRASRVTGSVASIARQAARPLDRYGFPFRSPTVPRGVTVPPEVSGLGPDYDTEWARRPLPTVVRGMITDVPMRIATDIVTRPRISGRDRLVDLERLDDPPPLIFAPTHHSHLDTALVIRSVPAAWRHKLIVAAAADYFFDKHWKATLSALALNAIPIDREAAGRKSADLIRELIADGFSLVIYPEGGRSPDGWGQPFKGGAAYLASRTGAPVVPMFIDGTGAIFGKGMKRPRPGRTTVVFGQPITPGEGESTRRLNSRIEAATAALGDESLTDYWSARRRAADGTSPSLAGPAYEGWRRDWALGEHRKLGTAGVRRPQSRTWPDLG
jgi:1-acyl-sn-glycerol-3-phosphate acyltransferase